MAQSPEVARLVGMISKLLVNEHERWQPFSAWNVHGALAYILPNENNYRFRIQNAKSFSDIMLEIADPTRGEFVKVELSWWQRLGLRSCTEKWFKIQKAFRDQIEAEKVASVIRKHVN